MTNRVWTVSHLKNRGLLVWTDGGAQLDIMTCIEGQGKAWWQKFVALLFHGEGWSYGREYGHQLLSKENPKQSQRALRRSRWAREPWGWFSHWEGPGPLPPCGFLLHVYQQLSIKDAGLSSCPCSPLPGICGSAPSPGKTESRLREIPSTWWVQSADGGKTKRRLHPEAPVNQWWGMQAMTACDPAQFVKWRLSPGFGEWGQTQALKSDCPGSASLFCSLAAWAGSVTSLSLRLLLRERARELYSLQRVVVKSGNSRNGPSLSAWYIASLSTWGLLWFQAHQAREREQVDIRLLDLWEAELEMLELATNTHSD